MNDIKDPQQIEYWKVVCFRRWKTHSDTFPLISASWIRHDSVPGEHADLTDIVLDENAELNNTAADEHAN